MRNDRLKEAREALNIAQTDLAMRVGLSGQQIYRIETGKSIPTADTLAKIARELGVSADWLVGLIDDPNGYSQGDLAPDERNLVSAYRRADWREAMRLFSEKGLP